MRRLIGFLLIVLMLCSCTDNTISPSNSSPEMSSASSYAPSNSSIDLSSVPNQTEIISILQNMTLEEKVGQLFLARCPSKNAVEDIQTHHPGGYILFASDFENQTPDSMKATISSYQAASNIPMLIAVDEEGGSVTRVSMYPAFRAEPFSSPRYLYKKGGLSLIQETEQEKCQLLGSLGINVNAAPVCDITIDPNAFMYKRSLGEGPEITGQFVVSVLQITQENHIGSILKHFPGYGNNTDTHAAVAVDNRSLSQLENNDLIPFSAGIQAGAQAIMISHVYINAIDPNTPATLSPAVHKYLRDTMGFQGVIVTDDLTMKAITDVYGAEESAVLAVLAGNDLLCATDYTQQYDAVLQAVMDGRIPKSILDSAVLRILRWKMQLGLI